MGSDGNDRIISVPDYKIDDVIQSRSASVTPEPEAVGQGTIPLAEGGSGRVSVGAIPMTEIKPEETALDVVPVAEVKAEDVGTFSVRYTGRVPQLVVTGGTVVPSVLTVVDESGNILAEYTARPATTAQEPAVVTSRLIPIDQNQLVGCSTPDCHPVNLTPLKTGRNSGSITAGALATINGATYLAEAYLPYNEGETR